MNKIVLYSLLTLGVIAVGVVNLKKNSQEPEPDTIAQDSEVVQVVSDNFETGQSDTEFVPSETENSSRKMSFVQFLKLEKEAHTCTVEQTVAGVASKGVVYVLADMVRGSFASEYGGIQVGAEFLLKDGFAYSWSKGGAVGFKVSIQPNKPQETVWNGQEVSSYDCAPGISQQDVFVVPQNIQFTVM
jgi:hypothetical protein